MTPFSTSREIEEKLDILSQYLSPERPIRSFEFLRGRGEELERLRQELSFYKSIPFIFGNRGVGKTSLARTVAQIVTKSDREHVYEACGPNISMLSIFRDIAQDLVELRFQLNGASCQKKREVEISFRPSVKLEYVNDMPEVKKFRDINEAVRALRELDRIIPDANKTVVIIDELEEVCDRDKQHLAYLVKQIGDQEFNLRFVLVGIAENVHDLIGTHASVPRYIHEVSLSPLIAQDLMDIVKDAADAVDIHVPKDVLYRTAIIGNGYPHFAHLIGKSLLHEAVVHEAKDVNAKIYGRAIKRAVDGSIEALSSSYNTATQRKDDVYKYLIWTLADSDVVDMRSDDMFERCKQLASMYDWELPEDKVLSTRLQRLSHKDYGKIIINTPKQGGSDAIRYRYKRFANNLMRGHVRLIAEAEGVQLGEKITL
ncbi:ATP-binding protein [Oceanidesulfovibrio marinus]|uniref:Orc1-like AAA ATPase domain-containing protein n=1 Tax=Oceanidesulfovibrio marinus TaxID=370038 RepID=A0A6P1ZBN9_9BACT|nr:ATP-binding protein [Oceanidesulfovibrio marinus]TVM31518.1 hypothetical protein DQK91_17780 [Oceanidesulfovibrio marinus]